MAANPELGCGLIAIGRQWGTTPHIPSEAASQLFLQGAYEQGIRYFDTAPSYGLSEERLGMFIRELAIDGYRSHPEEKITIATKFGEHWDADKQQAYVDHSYDALVRSIDQSLMRLGRIALLQLHKPSEAILFSKDFYRALTYAAEVGVESFGVSVSDAATAELVFVDDWGFDSIQLPYNQNSSGMKRYIELAIMNSMDVITNRPFAMGATVATGHKQEQATAAFRFILDETFTGTILTGTSNLTHLQENITAFEAAQPA